MTVAASLEASRHADWKNVECSVSSRSGMVKVAVVCGSSSLMMMVSSLLRLEILGRGQYGLSIVKKCSLSTPSGKPYRFASEVSDGVNEFGEWRNQLWDVNVGRCELT